MQPLLGVPRSDLSPGVSEQEVRDTLAFDYSPKVRHGYDVLDANDVETGESLRVETGEVMWSYRPPDEVVDGRGAATTDVAATRRQARFTVVAPTEVSLALARYRVWTELLSPAGNWLRWWLGVFLPTVPPANDDGMVIRYPLTLADKTYRYANRVLDAPLVIPSSTNAVQWVIDSLADEFGETAFSITSSDVVLDEAKTFNTGTAWLAVYNAMLQTAGFDQLTADESGRPSSILLDDLAAKGSEMTYGPGAGKIIVAGDVEPLLPTLPNVARFVARQGPSLPEEGNGIRTVLNQSSGPTSIDARGERFLVVVEVDAEDQVALDAIAYADAQRYFAGGGKRFTGKVALNPRFSNRDVITLNKPRLDLSGLWNVTAWTYPLHPLEGEDDVVMPIVCEQRVTVTEEA